jgi:hypothetical protein
LINVSELTEVRIWLNYLLLVEEFLSPDADVLFIRLWVDDLGFFFLLFISCDGKTVVVPLVVLGSKFISIELSFY